MADMMTAAEALRALADVWRDIDEIAHRLGEELSEIDRTRCHEPEELDDGGCYDGMVHPVDDEDYEAAVWVRDHGGLDHVRDEWRSRVPYDKHKMARQRLIDHIAECETALGCRRRRIEELVRRVGDLASENAELRKRAMPEGMEWPLYEDGEPVRLGDEFECWCGKTHTVESVTIREGRSALNASKPHMFVVSDGPFTAHGERVKRPAPKVLDADGVEIKVDDEVWSISGDGPMSVEEIRPSDDPDDLEHIVWCGDKGCELLSDVKIWRIADQLTHRAPVLAADGKPLEVGQTVWDVESGVKYEVVGIHIDEDSPVRVMRTDGSHLAKAAKPNAFTHTKPEVDSWKRIEEDKGLNPFDYCKKVGHKLWTFDNAEEFKASDLVRRCKALSERKRSE